MKDKKFCQSCAMPLETDEILGTNADGSKNGEYCVYCYKGGVFTQDVTMEGMIDISIKHMRELFANDPDFNEQEALAGMRSYFPQLKRWKA